MGRWELQLEVDGIGMLRYTTALLLQGKANTHGAAEAVGKSTYSGLKLADWPELAAGLGSSQ